MTTSILLKGLMFGVLAQQAMAAYKYDRYPGIDKALHGASQVMSPGRDCKPAFFSTIYNNANVDAVNKAIKDCPQAINSQFFDAVYPLHLAVMGGKRDSIEPLLKAGEDINNQDFNGFTALHHEAMKGNTLGVKRLLKNGADPAIKNKFNGTYMDLLRMNRPFRTGKDVDYPLDPTLFSAHRDTDIHHLDPQCLSSKFEFVYENVARPNFMIDMWNGDTNPPPKEQIESMLPSLMKIHQSNNENYAKFKTNPPQLSIKPVLTDDTGKPIKGMKAPCGLFATHPIKRGEVIAEYAGELIFDEKADRLKDKSYLWKDKDSPAIDARTYRSAAAMANDAFPNACVTGLQYDAKFQAGIDGLSHRKLMIALEDIAPGEQITINYAISDNTKHSHIELKPGALEKFYKENPWKTLKSDLAKIDNADATIEDVLWGINIAGKMEYLFQTPEALPYLIEKGLLKKEDLVLLVPDTKNPAAKQVATYALERAAGILYAKPEL